MIEVAEGLKEAGTIQVQANRYEGYMVFVNALIESAGTEILSGPEEVDLEQGPTEKALQVIGKLANSGAAPAEPLDLRRGHRPARLRGRRIGLHDQLHLRLRERPGRSAGNRQEHGLRALPAGRREQAEQAAARRLQPRGQLLLPEQGRRLRSGRLPRQRQEPEDRGRTRRAAALALRPLQRQSRHHRLPRLRPAGQGIDRSRPARGRPRPPTRTSRWRSSARCTRRTRSTPKTPNRSTTN